MDAGPAGCDWHGASGLKKFRSFEPQVSGLEMRGDLPPILKDKFRMETRSRQHVKRPGEPVLVNLRCPIEPKENLNAKPRIIKHHELRLPESRRCLEWLFVAEQEIFRQCGHLHMLRRWSFLQRLPGNIGKSREGKILPLPPCQHLPPELLEIRIHPLNFQESPHRGKN